jgi:hypothetical protein
MNFKTIAVDNGTDFHQYTEIENAAVPGYILPTLITLGKGAVTKMSTGSFVNTCPKQPACQP